MCLTTLTSRSRWVNSLHNAVSALCRPRSSSARAAAAARCCAPRRGPPHRLLRVRELAADLAGRAIDGALEDQQRDGQRLADLVVQLPCDALTLVLLRGECRGPRFSRCSAAPVTLQRWGSTGLRADPADSRAAFAVSMIASPTTSTGISVSLIRDDTVAGDTARISVPSTKIRPLIRKTRRNSAAAGRSRPVHDHHSGLTRGGLSIRSVPHPKWVSDPMATIRPDPD